MDFLSKISVRRPVFATVLMLTIVVVGLVNALVWYGRLHYRLLKPALEPQAAGETA